MYVQMYSVLYIGPFSSVSVTNLDVDGCIYIVYLGEAAYQVRQAWQCQRI